MKSYQLSAIGCLLFLACATRTVERKPTAPLSRVVGEASCTHLWTCVADVTGHLDAQGLSTCKESLGEDLCSGEEAEACAAAFAEYPCRKPGVPEGCEACQ